MALPLIDANEKHELIAAMERKMQKMGFKGSYSETDPIFEHCINIAVQTVNGWMSVCDSLEQVASELNANPLKRSILQSAVCVAYLQTTDFDLRKGFSTNAPFEYADSAGTKLTTRHSEVLSTFINYLSQEGFKTLCKMRGQPLPERGRQ